SAGAGPGKRHGPHPRIPLLCHPEPVEYGPYRRGRQRRRGELRLRGLGDGIRPGVHGPAARPRVAGVPGQRRMRAARLALAGRAVAATASSAAGRMQGRPDGRRTGDFGDELVYRPTAKLLAHSTAGTSGVVADLRWLKCIRYTSKHFQSDHKFTWLGHMT